MLVPEPWGPLHRTWWSSGRLLSRSRWREKHRRGPAELAWDTWPSGPQTRGRFSAALSTNVNWQFRRQTEIKVWCAETSEEFEGHEKFIASKMLQARWPAQLRCPSLKAFVTKVVEAQVDFCNGPVDTKGFGEGLQNWHEAHGQVDSRLWAFHRSCAVMHCQLAVPHVWHKHAQGTCQDCGYEPDMTPVRSSCHHPAHSIEHTSSLSQCVTHCNTFFNVKTFRNFVSYPEKG